MPIVNVLALVCVAIQCVLGQVSPEATQTKPLERQCIGVFGDFATDNAIVVTNDDGAYVLWQLLPEGTLNRGRLFYGIGAMGFVDYGRFLVDEPYDLPTIEPWTERPKHRRPMRESLLFFRDMVFDGTVLTTRDEDGIPMVCQANGVSHCKEGFALLMVRTGQPSKLQFLVPGGWGYKLTPAVAAPLPPTPQFSDFYALSATDDPQVFFTLRSEQEARGDNYYVVVESVDLQSGQRLELARIVQTSDDNYEPPAIPEPLATRIAPFKSGKRVAWTVASSLFLAEVENGKASNIRRVKWPDGWDGPLVR